MPIINTETTINYPIFDSVTGAYIADAPANHTFELLADGTEVAVADTGSTTTVTGVNQVTIAAGENTGVMMLLKITTSTSGVTIPAISWDNALAQPTVAQIADGVWDEALSGHATAGTAGDTLSDILVDTAAIGTTINVINVPLVAYNGTIILYKDDSYDDTLNPTVSFGSLLAADISGATAYIEITSEKDGAGTVYYTASDGTISGSSGAWTVAYSIPTTGTDDLPIGIEVAYYHAWVEDGTSVATVGKGRVTVR